MLHSPLWGGPLMVIISIITGKAEVYSIVKPLSPENRYCTKRYAIIGSNQNTVAVVGRRLLCPRGGDSETVSSIVLCVIWAATRCSLMWTEHPRCSSWSGSKLA